MKICLGLLLVFACPDEKPLAVSDFCELAGSEVVKFRNMTDEELNVLRRPRREAIRNLRQLYKQNCPTPPTASLRSIAPAFRKEALRPYPK